MPHPLREAISCGEVCRHLRTKGLFVFGYDGPPADAPHAPDAAQHWCVLSGWALGADGAPVNPRRCGDRQRACFQADGQS